MDIRCTISMKEFKEKRKNGFFNWAFVLKATLDEKDKIYKVNTDLESFYIRVLTIEKPPKGGATLHFFTQKTNIIMAYDFDRYTNKEELEKAIYLAQARNKGAKEDSVAVVTANKKSARARKVWYNFHFEKRNDCPKIGDVEQLGDGTVRRIEFICK